MATLTPDVLQGMMQQVIGPMAQMMERMLAAQQQSVQQLQNQQAALMSETGRSFAEVVNRLSTNARGGLIDNRGVGKPEVFKGEEGRFREWKAKFVGYVVAGNPEAQDWLKWAEQEKVLITRDSIETEANLRETDEGQAHEFSRKLHALLTYLTAGDPWAIVESAKDQCGLEAWRLVLKRYEPRTPGTKRAILKAAFNLKPAKSLEEVEKVLLHVEELVRKYDSMASQPLAEDVRATVLMEVCPKDLKDHLELTTGELVYREVRELIQNYVERKRDQFGKDLKAMEKGVAAMDVDSYEYAS